LCEFDLHFIDQSYLVSRDDIQILIFERPFDVPDDFCPL